MKRGKQLRDFLRSPGKRGHYPAEAFIAEYAADTVQEQPERNNSAERPCINEGSDHRLERLRPNICAIVFRQKRDMLHGFHVEAHAAGERAYFHALPPEQPQDGSAAYLHLRDCRKRYAELSAQKQSL